MRSQYAFLLWLMLAGVVRAGAVGEQGNTVSAPVSEEPVELRVLDVVIVGTNHLQIGTNSVPLNLVSNRIEQYRGDVDVIALHGAGGQSLTRENSNTAIERLVGIGIPLVVVEKEGTYSWRTNSAENGTRSIKVSTDQFAGMLRWWEGRAKESTTNGGLSLQTTIDWDTDAGGYSLSRVEVGVLNKHVWLVHEQRETDEDPGTIGIRIKKEW